MILGRRGGNDDLDEAQVPDTLIAGSLLDPAQAPLSLPLLDPQATTTTTERPPDLLRRSEANDPDATTTTTLLTEQNQQSVIEFQAATSEVMKDVETVGVQALVSLGTGLCTVGGDVDSLENFDLMVGLLWVGLETDMRSLFSSDGLNFQSAAHSALAVFCPETMSRLAP